MTVFFKLKILLLILMMLIIYNFTYSKSNKDILNLPSWFINPPKEDNIIYATGYAKKTNQQLAVVSASNMARTEISRILKTEINTITKQYLEDARIGSKSQITEFSETTSTSISENILYFSKIIKQEVVKADEKFIAYVLVKLDLKDMDNAINGELFNKLNDEFRKLDTKSKKDLEDLTDKINEKLVKQFNKKVLTQDKAIIEKEFYRLDNEEETKISTGKKPDWITRYPVSSDYYIGISNGGSLVQTKDNAINTLVSQIELTIKSEINDYIKETNDVTTEEVSQRIKLNVKQEIEDLELYDLWHNKEEGYWAYYRLSIAKYKQREQEKIENAKINGLDFLKRSDEETDPALKFKYAFLGYYLVGKYVTRALKANYNGKEIILVNELTSRMQNILSKFTIAIDKNNPEIDKINPSPVTLRFNLKYLDKPVANFPVKFYSNNAKLIFSETGITDVNGDVSSIITKSMSNELMQSLVIQPDIQSFLKDTAESEEDLMVFYNRISKLGIPSKEIFVKVNPPIFKFELNIEEDLVNYDNLVKSMSNNFKNSFITKTNAKFSDNNVKLKIIMNVSGTVTQSDTSGNYFTRLIVSLSIMDLIKNEEITTGTTGEKGIKAGANSKEKSVRFALDKFMKEYNDKLIEDLYNNLIK